MNETPMPPMPPTPGQPPKTEGLATTSMILGIVGLVCLGCLAGLPAVICGHMAKGRIKESGGMLGGSGQATAGLIMGYFSLAWTFVLGAIFAALAVPAFKVGAQKGAVDQLATALKAYHAEYDKWPIEDFRTDAAGSDVTVQKTLRGVDTNMNPSKKVFLDVPAKWIEKDRLVDAWGNPLNFWFDGNRDNTVTVGGEEIAEPVVVWSSGPNGRDEQGGGDDIASWKDAPLPKGATQP